MSLRRFVVAAMVSVFAGSAFAANLEVVDQKITGAPIAQEIWKAALKKIKQQIEDEFPTGAQASYLKRTANAAILSNKGLGADYATTPDLFVIGGGVGIGGSAGSFEKSEFENLDEKFKDLEGNGFPSIGVAPSATVMVGLSMSKFPFLQPYTFYANFATYTHSADEWSGKFTTIGAHVQYRWFQPSKMAAGVVKWGGLGLTTGLEYYQIELLYDVDVDQYKVEQDLVSGESKLLLTYDGDGRIGVDINQLSVPFELSTNLRLLYFLTFFGGAGVDLNLGNSETIADFVGPVDGKITDTGGTNVFSTLTGTGKLQLGEKESPTLTHYRLFMGLQVSIVAVHAFVQANYAPLDKAIGASLGARIAW